MGTNESAGGSRSGMALPIVVPQSAYDSEETHSLVSAVVDYTNTMLQSGRYLHHELPVNAMRSYYVDYYHAQVSNGGHGQFIGNTGWEQTVVTYVADGLREMDAQPFDEVFSDICKFVAECSAERLEAVRAGSGFGDIDPAVAAIDKKYFAQDAYEVLTLAHALWISRLSELHIVPDADYRATMEALCNQNPQRTARAAAANRSRMEQSLVSPLEVAGQLLCVKCDCRPMLGLLSGDPSGIAPDGKAGTAWQIETIAGRKTMFVFEDIAVLCDTYLADGRQLTDAVIAEQQRKLAEGDLDGIQQYAELNQKEIGRVTVESIQSAIDAATSFPVVKVAEMLCGALGADVELRRVFPGIHHNSEQWLWFMEYGGEGGISGGIFGLNGDTVQLNNFKMQPMAMLALHDIQSALDAEQVGHA